MFEAIINVPGYLPGNDEPMTFDTVGEAWEWLLSERERELNDVDYDEPEFDEDPCVEELAGYVDAPACGMVWGRTPGSDPEHDLGLAYSVVKHEPSHAPMCDLITIDGGYTMVCHTHHTSWPVTMGRLCPRVAPLIRVPVHASYPHEPGYLYDCPLCESRCFCDGDPGHTECVYCTTQMSAI